MTGYKSKRKAASAKTIDEVNWVDHEPDGRRAEQEPVAFAGIEMWVGNTKIKLCLTQMELHNAKEPWMLIEHMAEMCISKLKEKNNG